MHIRIVIYVFFVEKTDMWQTGLPHAGDRVIRRYTGFGAQDVADTMARLLNKNSGAKWRAYEESVPYMGPRTRALSA